MDDRRLLSWVAVYLALGVVGALGVVDIVRNGQLSPSLVAVVAGPITLILAAEVMRGRNGNGAG